MMMAVIRETAFLAILLIIAGLFQCSLQLSYRKSCIPESIDSRYEVCSCAKFLNVQCQYRKDINQISVDKQDPGVRSLKVTVNTNAEEGTKEEARTYFPNFSYFNVPFEVVNLKQFPLIPRLGFYNEYHLKEQLKYSIINLEYFNENSDAQEDGEEEESDDDDNNENAVKNSILADSYGERTTGITVDKHAFSGVEVNLLLIEGDYNVLKMHQLAFKHASINEIKLNCFSKMNIKNSKPCVLELVNETQVAVFEEKEATRSMISSVQTRPTAINAFKVYGMTILQSHSAESTSYDIDLIPHVSELKVLHIVDTRTRLKSFKKFITNKPDERLVNLVELNLRGNNISELNEAFFLKEKMANLVDLDLSNNVIFKIDLMTFFHLTKLETLDLSNNKLTSLSRPVFNGLQGLKKLVLKGNLIENLLKDQFDYLANLEVLDLSSNRIVELDASNFNNLIDLKQLQLEFNPYRRIAHDTFKAIGNSLAVVDLTSKLNRDWFYFDNYDICLLSRFKCNKTKIMLSTEQNCNCFLHYVNIINQHGDQSKNTNSCDVQCSNADLLTPCYLDDDQNDYSEACLYNLLKPRAEIEIITTTAVPTTTSTATTSTTTTSTTTTSVILNTFKATTHKPVPLYNDKSPNVILGGIHPTNYDEDVSREGIHSVRTMELTHLVYLSIFLSCLSLILLFIFTIVFSCMHAKYRKHAIYNIVPRND